ncbi:MAG: hypothetical protein ACYC2H_00805 [Thermoplasmatota archaeon]
MAKSVSPGAGKKADPKSTRRSEMALGIFLLAMGALITAAVSNPLEFAVYAGGPFMAIFGLVFAIRGIVKRMGVGPIIFGTVAFVLGSLLAVHDFLFMPGIAVFIHLGIGIATLVLGILQLLAKKRYYTRWFRGKSARTIQG